MSLLLSAPEKSKNVTSSKGSGSSERIFLCRRRVTGQDQVPETLRSPDETAEPEKLETPQNEAVEQGLPF